MGASLSRPPLTYGDCFNNGKIDFARYQIYLKTKRKREEEEDGLIGSAFGLNGLYLKRKCTEDTQEETFDDDEPAVRVRSVKRHKVIIEEADGVEKELTWKDSLWYLFYVQTQPRSNRQKKLFRQRFRLTYECFTDLVQEMKLHEMFGRWTKEQTNGEESSPLELLLLGFFRYAGRGFTYDDLEESTLISAETHRQFMMVFLKYGSTVLFESEMSNYDCIDEANRNSILFSMAGFPGCIGSFDGTHVPLECVADWTRNKHKGYKLKKSSRNYNVSCNHSRSFLSCTKGFPATWNDKTLSLFDDFLRGVYDGDYLENFEFVLLEYDREGNIIERTYKGPWFITDNGYLNWPVCIPPFKNAASYEQVRFSEWLESMRKDIECAFGILKGRWRILKYGLRFRKVEHCDQMFKTLCALHNRLLKVDGLDKDWMGIRQQDDGESEPIMNGDMPAALQRLESLAEEVSDHLNPPNYNLDWKQRLRHRQVAFTEDGKRVVRKMPQDLFRECLVEHFNIKYRKKELMWPKRRRSV